MISILVCLIQITLITSLTLNASKVFLSISPQLSARMSWLGIALSSLVVVATFVGVQRLWTFKLTDPTYGHSGHAKSIRRQSVGSQGSAATVGRF